MLVIVLGFSCETESTFCTFLSFANTNSGKRTISSLCSAFSTWLNLQDANRDTTEFCTLGLLHCSEVVEAESQPQDNFFKNFLTECHADHLEVIKCVSLPLTTTRGEKIVILRPADTPHPPFLLPISVRDLSVEVLHLGTVPSGLLSVSNPSNHPLTASLRVPPFLTQPPSETLWLTDNHKNFGEKSFKWAESFLLLFFFFVLTHLKSHFVSGSCYFFTPFVWKHGQRCLVRMSGHVDNSAKRCNYCHRSASNFTHFYKRCIGKKNRRLYSPFQ